MSGLWLICGLGFLATVFLSGFFSGAETGIYCVNRVSLQLKSGRGNRRARLLAGFLADEQSALSMTLIGTNLANYLATAVVAYTFARQLQLSDRQSELYTTLLVAPVIFVFGEVVPKNLFRRGADRLMYSAATGLTVASRLLAPAVWVIRTIARHAAGLISGPAIGDESVLARRRVSIMLREGLIHSGSDHPEHADLVERVLALSATSVHAVMVPRNRVVAIRSTSDRREFLSLVRKTTYLRLPVFDDNPRRIVGWVAVHELLADSSWQNLRDHVKPIAHLNPRDTVAATIVHLQKEKQSMAVVVDRNGLLLGLITIKDLMEEITGELVD